MAITHRSRTPAARITRKKLDEDLDGSPEVVRLRAVLAMCAEGRTQLEISEHFDRDVRTIRRWLKKAKELKLALSERLTPQEALADFLYGVTQQKAVLLRVQREAVKDNNGKLVLQAAREILRLEATYMALLERIGLFDHFAPMLAQPETLYTVTQEEVRENVMRIFESTSQEFADLRKAKEENAETSCSAPRRLVK